MKFNRVSSKWFWLNKISEEEKKNFAYHFRTSKKFSFFCRWHKNDGSYTVSYLSLVCLFVCDVNCKLIDINFCFNFFFIYVMYVFVCVCVVSICNPMGFICDSFGCYFYAIQSLSTAMDNNCIRWIYITFGWTYVRYWNKLTNVNVTMV